MLEQQQSSSRSSASYLGRNENLKTTGNPSSENSETAEYPQIQFVFKNQDVIVIDKPFDLHIDGDHLFTVEKLVNHQYPEMANPPNPIVERRGFIQSKRKLKFCHQLDYATSGILCLAFTRQTCAAISQCFQQRTAKKYYLAVVRGHMKENTFQVKSWIAEDPLDANNFRMRNYFKGEDKTPLNDLSTLNEQERKQAEESKESTTEGQALKRGYYCIDGDRKNRIEVTKILLKPRTGRRHQLRLHTQLLGHPILGDGAYGIGVEGEEGMHRMMLHAWCLSLPGVMDNELKTRDPFEADGHYFEWIEDC